MEIWKDIEDYRGYQVSNLGRIRTYNKTTYTKKHGIRHWKNRILKPKISERKNGKKEARVDLWKDGKPKTLLVARIVAYTFENKDMENHTLTVNHKDGNPMNNKLENLEIISLKENVRHALRTGLVKNLIKVKIENKITGTIIYPQNLAEGSRIIMKSHGYLSLKLKNNIFENNEYKWELI